MAQQVKNPPLVQEPQEVWARSLGLEDPLEEEMAIHSSILPEKSHGQRTLVGYSPKGCKELDTTKQLSTHKHPFGLSYMWILKMKQASEYYFK